MEPLDGRKGKSLKAICYTSDFPTMNNSFVATFTDDTAILASDQDSQEASKILQHLNEIEHWLKTWRIKINFTKCMQVIFTTRRKNMPTCSTKQRSTAMARNN
ncbi:RNA-directed DNA polymerase from mobile element jockey [Anthophora retusa]